MLTRCLAALLVSACLCAPSYSAPSGDNVHWSPEFGPPGLSRIGVGFHASVEGEVMMSPVCSPDPNCPLQFWDGSKWRAIGNMQGGLNYGLSMIKHGGVWYFGGGFESIDGVPLKHIAMWDGNRWSPMGQGLTGVPTAMAVHQNNLCVAGWPAEGDDVMIRRWDGANWIDIASGGAFEGGVVYSLMSDGIYLYAAGSFFLSGANVVRWNGLVWEPLGTGIDDSQLGGASSLALYKNEIYAVAQPSSPLAGTPNLLWKWNGTQWSKIDAVYRGGSPTSVAAWKGDLYVSGSFTNIDNKPIRNLARYDGAAFHALPGGVSGGLQATPDALYVGGNFDYVSLDFEQSNLMLSPGIAKWDGEKFSPVRSEKFSNGAGIFVAAFADQDGTLYAGGTFRGVGGTPANAIAAWDGSSWKPLGSGMDNRGAVTRRVSAIATLGGEVFAGGTFTHAGGVPAANVAIWDGQSWRAAGAGLNAPVSDLVTHNGQVVALGQFTSSGGEFVFFVAGWNGFTWTELGCCLGATAGRGGTDAVSADGRLFVAGGFFGGGSYTNTVYELVGEDYVFRGGFDRPVTDITFFEGKLYASGDFRRVNGVSMSFLAAWDGVSWTQVQPMLDAQVAAMAIHNGSLHVVGNFANSGVTTGLNGIARLDQGWARLGSGFSNAMPASARPSAIHSMGDDLFVGGIFIGAGEGQSHNIAKWNDKINFYDTPSSSLRIESIALSGNNILLSGIAPDGAVVALETSSDLRNWSEAASYTGSFIHATARLDGGHFFRLRLK